VRGNLQPGLAVALGCDTFRKIFCARSPLDLRKDYLALEALTLENLLTDWRSGNVSAAYFMLPFVALNLAVRNPRFSVERRKSLIAIAFNVFFAMIKTFPETGFKVQLFKIGGRHKTKTFWTKAMCKRACNLCVGLGWALIKWGGRDDFWLALSRIPSHPVECPSGMTRGTLTGDVRWMRFFAAQVVASLMQTIMWT
jgi:hypothetical protein